MIPDDFDPFSAKPSADAMRNTDDPLRALAEGAMDLGGVAPVTPPLSLVDFEPKVTRDPLEALGGSPSLVDPHDAVDPLQMFGGDDDKLLGGGSDAIPAGRDPHGRRAAAARRAVRPGPKPRDRRLRWPRLCQFRSQRRQPAPPSTPTGDETRIAPRPVTPRRPFRPTRLRPHPRRSLPRLRLRPWHLRPHRSNARHRSSKPHRAAAAPPSTDVRTLVAAFLDGAGVPEGGLTRAVTPEAMRELGMLVYQAVAGAMALIAVRQITKREIGAELTMIVATRNNPLKFLPTPEAAVMQILGPRMPGFMAPVDSMTDAFDDLRAHEVGVIAGTRAAFTEVLRRFDPKELEQRLGKGGFLDGVLPGHRDARLWELFVARFQEVYKDAQDDFDSLLRPRLHQAYEAEVRRARAERRR